MKKSLDIKLSGQREVTPKEHDVLQKALMRSSKIISPQTKPLSDEEILHIYSESYRNTLMGIDPLAFARAIEAKVRGEK